MSDQKTSQLKELLHENDSETSLSTFGSSDEAAAVVGSCEISNDPNGFRSTSTGPLLPQQQTDESKPGCYSLLCNITKRLGFKCRGDPPADEVTVAKTQNQEMAMAPMMINKNTSRKIELEQEVSRLEVILHQEERLNQILKQAVQGCGAAPIPIPSFLPPKVKEVLAELTMVEGEIARLENDITLMQRGSSHGYKVHEMPETKESHIGDGSNFITCEQTVISRSTTPRKQSEQVKRAPEARSLFFIDRAIKGDFKKEFLSNEKTTSLEVVNLSVNRWESTTQDNVSMNAGVGESPLLAHHVLAKPPKYKDQENSDGISSSTLPNPKTIEQCTQKWHPNKLAESIMKCLTCIYMRLIRTTRAIELEKSGPLSKFSQFSLGSKSFRSEGGANQKSGPLSLRRQDPYGVLEIEGSLARDIGPYKNYVIFASNALDAKSISSCLPLLRKLRALIAHLGSLDLKFLTDQQKLAFWINMYNASIMHGYLQFGVPTTSAKILSLMNKAVLNIGGNKLNAVDIERFILGQDSSLTKVAWNAENDDNEGMARSIHAIQSPEPNVAFALSRGTQSSPAVRIYTPDGISTELEKAKLEYLQASIVVTSTKKILLPQLLVSTKSDFARDLESLVEWVCNQLPTSGSLRKSIMKCFGSQDGGRSTEILEVLQYNFEFQYLLAV